MTFDITRNPNPHLGFGGTGAHFCIGANLARMEIDLMFNAIADNVPDITKIGDPRRLRSGWINGIKEFPGRLQEHRLPGRSLESVGERYTPRSRGATA